ncbi:MAG: response regulator transcription factor [Polynucleobacter sp.]|nr:response regulator transcription factor [Polynucleobacter sp.]MDZ4057543.1 response regulator transcription factor [Polynucleobacter sp.]
MNSTITPKIIRVSIIDPQQITLWGLRYLVDQDPRFLVCSCTSNVKESVNAVVDNKPDLILYEPNFENQDGGSILDALVKASNAKIIIVTGSRNDALHDQAIVKGARGIISKSESSEVLLKAMEKIHEGELWLNRTATSRILEKVTRAGNKEDLSPEQQKLALLTPKEENVTRAIQLYSRNTLKEIADNLHISEHTLRNHLASIYDKVGVRNRMELYVFCGKYQKTTDPNNHPRRRATDI